MKREVATEIFEYLENKISNKSDLREEVDELRLLLSSERFQISATRLKIEKIMMKSPKKIKNHIYNFLYSKVERSAGWENNKAQSNKASSPSNSNIFSHGICY